MTDLTARIAALLAQGYELPELIDFMEPTGLCDEFVVFRELITALEQAQARVEHANELCIRDLKHTEQRAEQAEAATEHYREIIRDLRERLDTVEALGREGADAFYAQERKLEQAEAALTEAHDRMSLCSGPCHGLRGDEYVKSSRGRIADLKAALRNEDKRIAELMEVAAELRDELAAEREKRCATCSEWDRNCYIGWEASRLDGFAESTTRCAGWQPRQPQDTELSA